MSDTATSEPVIEVHGLVKRYGAVTAVDGIDLVIRRGEIFGLLGPNGAGKTTVILMLLGLTETSAGTVRVVGLDPTRAPLAVKRRVGYLPDSVGFYDNMTARENLRYTAKLAGIPRAEVEDRMEVALGRVGLSGVADRRVATYSRGMRQRLGLSEIWLKRAEIAILDEPTSGLDPQATLELLDMIRNLKADGVAVMLSSHLLERVQSVCDRVALFNRGRIALIGTVGELATTVFGGDTVIQVEADGDGVPGLLERVAGVRRVTLEGSGTFRLFCARDVRAELAAALVGGGAQVKRLNLLELSLEAIYARYFEEHRDAA
ncbi:MAG TPA: ABC transporter ATP-binding protein [Candidatus Sulfotelmatobacter sp.]|nr:ABC transporter ATP-binding protein [Candidatus Sulfotelmatobacter sp.]